MRVRVSESYRNRGAEMLKDSVPLTKAIAVIVQLVKIFLEMDYLIHCDHFLR